MCYKYKLKWNKEHYTTPILSALVFNKLKAILGGKLNFLLSGSAPLSAETQVRIIIVREMWEIMIMFCQEFLRTCLEVDIVQGFTMTEATCSGTLQPVGCKQVKWKTWFLCIFNFTFVVRLEFVEVRCGDVM